MFYWRDDNFKGLAAISQSLDGEPTLKHFTEYLKLRERGLRKQAFGQLEQFLADVSSLSEKDRRELVHRLMLMHREWPRVFDLIPTPLQKGLIRPVLDKWINEEPANPIPLRWRGHVDDLRRAIELDPAEQIAREDLARRLLYQVDYSIHELPVGYLGDAAQDLATLMEVELLANGLHSEQRDLLLAEVEFLREPVEAYVAYQRSACDFSFSDWMRNEARTLRKRWQTHPFVR